MTLPDFLQEHSEAIMANAEKGLSRAHLSHYEQVGHPAAVQRLERLLELATECARSHDLGRMISHAGQVARERYTAGFALYEVQTAFNVLEEAIWLAVMEAMPVEEQGRALGLLSTILGAGKDALAREYVDLARRRAPQADPTALLRGV